MKKGCIVFVIVSTLAFARPNDAPLITNIDILSLPFQPNQRTLVVDAYDPDRDPISFLVTSATRGVDIFPQGERFQIRFPSNSTFVDISVIVYDGRGGSSQQRWDLLSRNQAPIINKFDTTIDFADNGDYGSLFANAVDPDGDPLEYEFQGLSKHHQLVDILNQSQNGDTFFANIGFHEHHRGSINMVFEVRDLKGGVSKATIPVRLGTLLRKIASWELSTWGMNAVAMDLDRDGNVYLIGPGFDVPFIGLDMKGNLIREGILEFNFGTTVLAIDRYAPQQTFLASDPGTSQRVYLYDFQSGAMAGHYPTPGRVSALLPLPNNETLVSFGYSPLREIFIRDSSGSFAPFGSQSVQEIKQMSRDPFNGDIYAVDRPGAVLVFDVTGNHIRTITGPEKPFNQPQGVLYDAAEDVLIVSDTLNNRMIMVDPVTGALHQTYEDASPSFQPQTILQQPNGQILVLNMPTQTIEVFVLD